MQRVMVFGDSNSFGTAPSRRMSEGAVLPRGARWPDRMAAELARAEVIVEGLPGRTTVLDDPVEGVHKNGLTVLPALIESHAPIDLLVIMLGTNDLKHRFGLGAQDVAKGVGRLVSLALASGLVAKVLAVAPPQPQAAGDFAAMFAGVEQRGAGLAAQIERFAGEAGAGVFDAGAVIGVDPMDGIHFGAEAHARLGAALAARVREDLA